MKIKTMIAHALALAGVGILIAGSGPPPAAPRLAPGQDIPQAELEAFVDGVVVQGMADRHIAGVTVSVVQNGQVVLMKGYGFAGLQPYRPVDPDRTLFRVGSISKIFTWILVHRQVESGHMRLDAPINLYLPEALRIPDDRFTQPIRVRDLMNHTPGFEDRILGQGFERDYARVRPLETYLRQERPNRVREPQTVVSYSNYGAGLAGAGVSEVTGKPFEALVETQITGPLGMSHTTFREPHPARRGMPAPMSPSLAAGISEGYRWSPSGFRRRPFEYIEQIAPAGAASSTAGDMARFMLMLLGNGVLDGVQIYGAPTAVAFSTPLPRPAPGVPAWRHGLLEYPLPGHFLGVGHDGGTLSFQSSLVIVPQLKLGVFVSTNTASGGALAQALPARIVQRFYAAAPTFPAPGTLALLSDRGAFEGAYLINRRAAGGLEGFIDRLIGEAAVKVTDNGRLAVDAWGEIARYAPIGQPEGGQFLAEDGVRRLVFQMQDGRARRFYSPFGEVAFDRIPLWRQRNVLLLLTGLVTLVSLAALGDLFARARRDFRESSTQRRAGLLQTTQAVLWLLAMGLLAFWAAGAGDTATVVYNWPGLPLILASACALVSGLLAVFTLLLLPLVWRGGRRVDSWSGLRKTRFTLTALLFLTYAGLLASSGFLEPWSG
jgi:CubicO group peptidase (beta-lactamase class C family)